MPPFFLFLCFLLSLFSGVFAWFFQVTLLFTVDIFHKNNWLVFFLPLAALFIYWFYEKIKDKGISSPGGRVVSELSSPKSFLPFLLIPVTYFFTLFSHLFGASVGREGVAVQVGTTFAENLGRWFRVTEKQKKTLMMCGVASGFAALFGTPLTAVAFAYEFCRKKPSWRSAPAVLGVSFLSYGISDALGTPHTQFSDIPYPEFWLNVLWFDGALCIALLICCWVFIKGQQFYGDLFSKTKPFIKPVLTSLMLTITFYFVGTSGFASLGLPFIAEAFSSESLQHGVGDAFLKLVLIAFSLQAGFKGGEVTPLFATGALLGAAIAFEFGLSPEFGAAIGLSVLFPSLAKAPMTGIILGIEVFGLESLVHVMPIILVLQGFGPKKGLYR